MINYSEFWNCMNGVKVETRERERVKNSFLYKHRRLFSWFVKTVDVEYLWIDERMFSKYFPSPMRVELDKDGGFSF